MMIRIRRIGIQHILAISDVRVTKKGRSSLNSTFRFRILGFGVWLFDFFDFFDFKSGARLCWESLSILIMCLVLLFCI